ncbi:MAG: hypothetical protein ACT4TC_03975 [Myxococcaceae bacterium]
MLEAIRTRKEKGWGPRAAGIVKRFGTEIELGDFVWTRDTSGRYLLGQITGPYRYDLSAAATAVDVHQVRTVDWAPHPINDLDVPGGVIRCFVGRAECFCRVRDDGARKYTFCLWEQIHGRPPRRLGMAGEEILTRLLDPHDVEDLVYVWLQVVHGYVVLPRARKRDTPVYEFTVIHRDTGRRAIAQVKTGSTPVDLDALRSAAANGLDAFAYATSGKYVGDRSCTTVIETAELLRFCRESEQVLPPRVRTWLQTCS